MVVDNRGKPVKITAPCESIFRPPDAVQIAKSYETPICCADRAGSRDSDSLSVCPQYDQPALLNAQESWFTESEVMRSKFVSQLAIVALFIAQVLSPLNAMVFARDAEAIRPDTVTGTIKGMVQDRGGAPTPGVRVRVTNVDNGNFRTVITGADGWYQVPFLPLGLYKIEAFKEGFAVMDTSRAAIKIPLHQTLIFAPPIILGPLTGPTPSRTPTPSTPTPPAPTPPVAQEEELGQATNQTDATRRSNSDEQMVSLLPLGNIRSF